MNLDLDFILLNLLLLYTFWKAGRNISQSMDYWHNAGLCVILFSIVQGCRFARGNDYFAYSRIFREGSLHVENPFFSVINELLRIVGINEYSCFMVYAFTFALCAMIFMKDYRTYARYMFPLFLIGFMNFEESMIRRAFSYSFSSYIWNISLSWNLTSQRIYCITIKINILHNICHTNISHTHWQYYKLICNHHPLYILA